MSINNYLELWKKKKEKKALWCVLPCMAASNFSPMLNQWGSDWSWFKAGHSIQEWRTKSRRGPAGTHPSMVITEKRASQGPSFLLEHWTHPYWEEGNLNGIQQTYTRLGGWISLLGLYTWVWGISYRSGDVTESPPQYGCGFTQAGTLELSLRLAGVSRPESVQGTLGLCEFPQQSYELRKGELCVAGQFQELPKTSVLLSGSNPGIPLELPESQWA